MDNKMFRKLFYDSQSVSDTIVSALRERSGEGAKAALSPLAKQAEDGKLSVVVWMVESGFPLSTDVFAAAAHGGHMCVLRWLRKKGCPMNEDACAAAAHGGHMCALRWLRKKRCPWNSRTCENAAKENHMAVLMWAVKSGCPIGKAVLCAYGVERLLELGLFPEKMCAWCGKDKTTECVEQHTLDVGRALYEEKALCLPMDVAREIAKITCA